MPKVKFTTAPLGLEVDWLHGFLFQQQGGWGRAIIRKHPGLRGVYDLRSETKQVAFIRDYVKEYRSKRSGAIERRLVAYERRWRRVEGRYFSLLEEIMGTEWPERPQPIKAMASVNIICPRFLDDWSFFIFVDYKRVNHAIETIMHETSHFLYFKKWREVFPDADPATFEAPHTEWVLSELAAPIILNDPRVQELLGQKAFFYQEHEKIRIGRKSAPEHFTAIYRRHMKKGDFKGFLKEGLSDVKKYGKKFGL